jgi:hypothetical protein
MKKTLLLGLAMLLQSGVAYAQGSVDVFGTDWKVKGWTLYANVDIWVGGQPGTSPYGPGPQGRFLAATCPANIWRSDLGAYYGYECLIPDAMRSGTDYYVYGVDGNGGYAYLGSKTVDLGSNRVIDASMHISNSNSGIDLYTHEKWAGAITSLTWNGQEFVTFTGAGDNWQSAMQLYPDYAFSGKGECRNPTEAGTLGDYSRSTSILETKGTWGNALSTTSLLAGWVAPPWGGWSDSRCSGSGYLGPYQNQKFLDDQVRLWKSVTIGYGGNDKVIRYLSSFYNLPSLSDASFEAVTGYMPTEFNTFYTFTNGTATGVSLPSTSPCGAEFPIVRGSYASNKVQAVIASTSSGNHAVGVVSRVINGSYAAAQGADYALYHCSSAVTKWAGVFRGDPSGSAVEFETFIVVGSYGDVLYALNNTIPLPSY